MRSFTTSSYASSIASWMNYQPTARFALAYPSSSLTARLRRLSAWQSTMTPLPTSNREARRDVTVSRNLFLAVVDQLRPHGPYKDTTIAATLAEAVRVVKDMQLPKAFCKIPCHGWEDDKEELNNVKRQLDFWESWSHQRPAAKLDTLGSPDSPRGKKRKLTRMRGGAPDGPEEPSEEEYLPLRHGMIPSVDDGQYAPRLGARGVVENQYLIHTQGNYSRMQRAAPSAASAQVMVLKGHLFTLHSEKYSD